VTARLIFRKRVGCRLLGCYTAQRSRQYIYGQDTKRFGEYGRPFGLSYAYVFTGLMHVYLSAGTGSEDQPLPKTVAGIHPYVQRPVNVALCLRDGLIRPSCCQSTALGLIWSTLSSRRLSRVRSANSDNAEMDEESYFRRQLMTLSVGIYLTRVEAGRDSISWNWSDDPVKGSEMSKMFQLAVAVILLNAMQV
jgi:hypothetical protein